ncbi:cytochrome bd ubiquinol oxidase subunit II [Methylacidimicrobium cyclopophantes]|uniref:Cytochrome bd ubiquinol oxidase subunit II n=1 Tax=Methylacidimicrobium cyclopophantes TaxID=1041766 RepID=A0A5E6MB49_9BACT|nr:cytochrome d ubiquinol oxidase subunit II [Methylacidimicrobium cyclopophantes]VVM06200.1 cytochrome bd ubiquinol oxidase subunit II [Methylacidimicrobium cyclopophantes]
METLWFVLLVGLLSGYIILDGFDFGTGILLPFLARTEEEKRNLYKAIGPIWDGNEVWLIASGGLLFFAFPKAYASALSGFYLAFMIFVWILILRGISIEIRSQLAHPLWRNFWDAIFFLASLLAALVLGALLGNLVTGVPIDGKRSWFLPLWTYFVPSSRHGIFDALTLLFSLLAVVSLSRHGGTFLILKTQGELQEKLKRATRRLWKAEAALVALSVVLLLSSHHFLFRRCWHHPLGAAFLALSALSLLLLLFSLREGRELLPFVCSSFFLLSTIGATAVGLYPYLLLSSLERSQSLTIFNAAASASTLRSGLLWFGIGVALILLYTFVSYWSFRGKVEGRAEEY